LTRSIDWPVILQEQRRLMAILKPQKWSRHQPAAGSNPAGMNVRALRTIKTQTRNVPSQLLEGCFFLRPDVCWKYSFDTTIKKCILQFIFAKCDKNWHYFKLSKMGEKYNLLYLQHYKFFKKLFALA
jgi:hypothetical protein